ncbi:unnamed protein product [Victoria cruziana]
MQSATFSGQEEHHLTAPASRQNLGRRRTRLPRDPVYWPSEDPKRHQEQGCRPAPPPAKARGPATVAITGQMARDRPFTANLGLGAKSGRRKARNRQRGTAHPLAEHGWEGEHLGRDTLLYMLKAISSKVEEHHLRAPV